MYLSFRNENTDPIFSFSFSYPCLFSLLPLPSFDVTHYQMMAWNTLSSGDDQEIYKLLSPLIAFADQHQPVEEKGPSDLSTAKKKQAPAKPRGQTARKKQTDKAKAKPQPTPPPKKKAKQTEKPSDTVTLDNFV